MLQSRERRIYFDNLLKAVEGFKVVLFFDEVHESIHNFSAELIPNLLRWNGKIEKVFIASATYTPDTLPIIRACSLLTANKLRIFQADRNKYASPVPISLHIIDKPYSSKSRTFLALIKKAIMLRNSAGKPVNVLTGTKAMANALAQYCFDKNVISDEKGVKNNASLKHVNLCTNDTKRQRQAGQNNIGTTFKTGHNINEGSLFIVLPCINDSPLHGNYGIFTDGLPSLMQAIGRMRAGGDIHVYLYKPAILLGEKIEYPDSLNGLPFKAKLLQEECYHIVVKQYEARLKARHLEIEDMEDGIVNCTTGHTLRYRKNQFGFWYPNLYEFLLKYSSNILIADYSFGHQLSPVMLHSLITDQFSNARLKNIIEYDFQDVVSLNSNMEQKLKHILSTKQESLKQESFRRSADNIVELLSTRNSKTATYNIKFRVDDQDKLLSAARLLNRKPEICKIAIEQTFNLSTEGKINLDDKPTYILSCVNQASKSAENTKLIDIYKALATLLDQYKQFVNKYVHKVGSKTFMEKDAYQHLPVTLLGSLKEIVADLKDYDIVFKLRAISLLQGLENYTTEQAKKVAFQFLNSLCYEVTTVKKQISKLKCVQINSLKLPLITTSLLS